MQSNKTFEQIVSLSINVSNFAHGPVVMPGYIKKLEEEHRELMELFEHYGELPPPRERLEDELADNLYVIIKLANFFSFNAADLLMYATNKAFVRILNPGFMRDRKDATNFPRGGVLHQTMGPAQAQFEKPGDLLRALEGGCIPIWANALKNLERQAKKQPVELSEIAEIKQWGPDMCKAGVAFEIGTGTFIINTAGVCALSQIEENEKNLNRANLSPAGDINKAIKELTDLVNIQSGMVDGDDYMLGLANGLICALATIKHEEPKYIDKPEEITIGKPKEGIEYFDLPTVREICKEFITAYLDVKPKKVGKMFDQWYAATGENWEKTIFITPQDDGPEFPDKQPGADVQHSEPEYMVILWAIAAGKDTDATQHGQYLRRQLLESGYINHDDDKGYLVTNKGEELLMLWSTGASVLAEKLLMEKEPHAPQMVKVLNTAIEKLRQGVYKDFSNSEVYEMLKQIAESPAKTQRDPAIPARSHR